MSYVRISSSCILLASLSSSLFIACGAVANPPALEAVVVIDSGTNPPEFPTAYWSFAGVAATAPVIDENGKIAFTGVIFGDGITPANNRVIWHGAPGDWSVLARSGSAALPGVRGLTFATLNSATPINTPNGMVSAAGTLAGTGVTTINDTAWWFGLPASLTLAIREGNAAPGTAGATFSGTTLTAGTRANNAGQLLLTSGLTGGDTVTANNTALFLTGPGGLTKLWRKGDPAPGAPALPSPIGPFISHSDSSAQINGSGDVVMTGSLVAGTSGGVTTSDDGILFAVEAGAPRIIARENGAFPGMTDVVYKVTGAFTLASRGINNHGKILFNAFAANSGTNTEITTANDSFWLVDDHGSVSVALREGDSLGAGTFSTVNLQNIALNNNNRMAFNSTVTLAVSPFNLGCVFEGPIGGPYTAIVTQGDAVPGLTGVNIDFASNNATAYNNADQIVFFSNLIGPGVTVGVNDKAILCWDASNGIRLVARTGTPMFGSGLPLSGLTLTAGAQNGECGSAVFTDNGWLTFSVTDVKGFRALVRTNLAPEPACASDVNGDDAVNVNDLLAIIGNWGACADPDNCPADVNGDDAVNVNDLLAVIGNWGPCP